MSNSYNSLCDDLYVDMYVNTKLNLPMQRDTILAFFERIQKYFPAMNWFYRRENDEYCLEENRNAAQYRWVTLHTDHIGSGVVNPASFEDAYKQDRLILDLVPFMLGVSHLDIDSLDVTFAMDFAYGGNHDEVIAEAILSSSAFNCLLDLPAAKAVGCSPVMVVALSDDCRTQARVSIESKTSLYEPDKQTQNRDEAITLSFTIRQYSSGEEKFDALKSFERQCRAAEELMAEKIVPNFVQPLINVIAQKRLNE
jgi:hypothetical protein